MRFKYQSEIGVHKNALNGLKIVADLIYFDGPILSQFKNASGEHYLYCWSDVDEEYNRWLVFRVTTQTLNLYLAGKVSLRDLLLNPIDGFLYSVDIDDDWQYHNLQMVQPIHLPLPYLPDTDSYYDFEPIFFEDDEETPETTQDYTFFVPKGQLLPLGVS
jgi:hypothetical protein